MSEKIKKISLAQIISVLVVLVLFIVIGMAWYLYKSYYEATIPTLVERGQFGDMFGGLNTLFSGFAFAGLIIAIILQSKELRLQREELRITNKAMKESADAQIMQVRALGLSARLNAYGSLIEHYGKIMTNSQALRLYDFSHEELKKKVKNYREKIEEIELNMDQYFIKNW